MMNLFPEFAGNAASALGSAAGGLLGQLGTVLSAPRRLLWGAVGGPEHGSDLAARITGDDADSTGSKVLGFGLEVLGDPLTFLGGPLLRALGGAANRSLSRAAWAAGPGYSDDAGKILAGIPASNSGARARVSDLLREAGGPEARAAIAREVPEGSRYLGNGASGVAMETPQGGVVRLGPAMDQDPRTLRLGNVPTSRADSPLILQAARDARVGPVRIEHVPRVETVQSARQGLKDEFNRLIGSDITPETIAKATEVSKQIDSVSGNWARAANQLRERAYAAKLEPWDVGEFNLGNIARTRDGRWLTPDPTAIVPSRGELTERGIDLLSSQPGWFKSRLLSLLGGQGRVRDYLTQQTTTGGIGQGVIL